MKTLLRWYLSLVLIVFASIAGSLFVLGQPQILQFEGLPKLSSCCGQQDSATIAEATGYDYPWVRAIDHSLDIYSVSSYAYFVSGSRFASEGEYRVIPGYWERQTLTGTVDRYGTFTSYWYPDENDWNLNIIPDPAYGVFVDPLVVCAFDPNCTSSWHVSQDGRMEVVVAELTPLKKQLKWPFSGGKYPPFYPWMPISSFFNFESSELVGKKVGVYGVFVGDFGHGGRPEIHPFDAIWWEDSPGEWRFGVFWDDSNRFQNSWSRSPRALTFFFPFQIPMNDGDNITLDVAVGADYNLNNQTEATFGADETQSQWRIRTQGGKAATITVRESDDRQQNVLIEGLRRCNNVLYGQVRVRVAVGSEGWYFGRLGFVESKEGLPPPASQTTAKRTASRGEDLPAIELSVEETMEPRVTTVSGQKTLEFGINVSAKLAEKEVPRIWNWKKLQWVNIKNNRSFQPVESTMTKGAKQSFAVRVGEPDFAVQLEVNATDGKLLRGQLYVPGFGLWSRVDPVDLNQKSAYVQIVEPTLGALKTHTTLTVPSSKLLQAVKIPGKPVRENYIARLTNASYLSSLQLENVLLLSTTSRYVPIRDRQTYGEEESGFSERLNNILYAQDKKSEVARRTLFGSDDPLRYDWQLVVRDLDGQILPLKTSTLSLKEAINFVESRGPKDRVALLLTRRFALKGDAVVLVLPRGIPYRVNGQVVVSDPFAQSHVQQVQAFNFGVVGAPSLIAEATGITLGGIEQMLQSTDLGLRSSTGANPWPQQPGYFLRLQGVRNELHALISGSSSPYRVKRLLGLTQALYDLSTPTQRAVLTGSKVSTTEDCGTQSGAENQNVQPLEVRVTLDSFYTIEESSEDGFFTDSDEPYAIVTSYLIGEESVLQKLSWKKPQITIAPLGGNKGGNKVRYTWSTGDSVVFGDVDSGENRRFLQPQRLIFEGQMLPQMELGFSITIMEEDDGDDDLVGTKQVVLKYDELKTLAQQGRVVTRTTRINGADEGDYRIRWHIEFNPSELEKVEARFTPSDEFAIGNLRDDAKPEMLVVIDDDAPGNNGLAKMYNSSGDLVDSKPIFFTNWDRVVVGDVLGDSYDEIIVVSDDDGGKMRIYDGHGILLKEVPFTNYTKYDGVAVGHPTSSTGSKDRILLARDDDNRIFIFDANGSQLSSFDLGWNFDGTRYLSDCCVRHDRFAVGNVIGDASDEIVMIEESGGNSLVFVYGFDGSLLRRFTPQYFSPHDGLLLADVMGDNHKELLIAVDGGDGENGYTIFVRDMVNARNAERYWPAFTPFDGLAAGDLDGDGKDEIALAVDEDYRIHVGR